MYPNNSKSFIMTLLCIRALIITICHLIKMYDNGINMQILQVYCINILFFLIWELYNKMIN